MKWQPAENQTAADTTDTSDSAADSADAAQPADTATDDSVIDIGTEDYLEIPEEGQSNDASEADNAQDAQAPEEFLMQLRQQRILHQRTELQL